jgi:hypothetical protein
MPFINTASRNASLRPMPITGAVPVPNSAIAARETAANGYLLEASAMPTESKIRCFARSRTAAGMSS